MQLANQPDKLIKKLLLDITENGQFMKKESSQVSEVSSIVLSKLLYIIGHVAIKQLAHLDVSIYKELKRRNTLREMQGKKKKQISKATLDNRTKSANSSTNRRISRVSKESSILNEDNGEEALEGAIDDVEAEFVNEALENEIVIGNGLLVKFMYVFDIEN